MLIALLDTAEWTAALKMICVRAQHNFTLVVLAIVLVSVLPIVAEIIAARREAVQSEQGHGDI